MLVERHICQRRQIGKERIKVRNVFQEKVFYGFGGTSKVNYRVRPILSLGELLDNIALANTPCAIYQQGALTRTCFLPLKETYAALMSLLGWTFVHEFYENSYEIDSVL
jgi:hypothetical protein